MFILDPIDTKIMRLIKRKPHSTVAIARQLQLARTTVAFRLTRLRANNLVRSEKGPANSLAWEPVFPHQLHKSSVTVFEGASFLKGYTAQWRLKKGSIIYAVEGAKAIEYGFKTLPRAFVIKTQEQFRRRQIVIKSILNQKTLDFLKTIDQALLTAHAGRAMGIKAYTSEHLFHECSQVIAAPNFVLIANTKSRRSVLFRDKEVVTLMYSLLALLFDFIEMPTVAAKKVQLQSVIESALKR